MVCVDSATCLGAWGGRGVTVPAVLRRVRCERTLSVPAVRHPAFVPTGVSCLSSQELISQMLQVNVEARCTAGQILSHPWVSVSTHVPGGPTSLCPAGRSGPPRLGCGADRGLGPRSVAPWASFSVVTLPALWRMRQAPGPSVRDRAHPVSAGCSVLTCEVLSKDLFPSSWGLRVFSTCPEMSLCQSRTSVFLARGHRSAPAPGGAGRSRVEDV